MLPILPADHTDARAIASCELLTKIECFNAPADHFEQELDLRATRWEKYLLGEHHPQKALAERSAWKIKDKGEISAYIAGHLSTRLECEGELQSIYIRKQYQRQGHGSRLLKVLFDWFREHEARHICVGVEKDNPYIAFYEKHGAERLNQYYLHWLKI